MDDAVREIREGMPSSWPNTPAAEFAWAMTCMDVLLMWQADGRITESGEKLLRDLTRSMVDGFLGGERQKGRVQ